MNRCLMLLVAFALLAAPSRGQHAWQKTKKYVSGVKGWVLRDTTLYPMTLSGSTSFTAAVKAGQLPISLTNPDNVPPGQKGKYGYTSGHLFTVEAAGDVSQLMFTRNDGTPLTGTNGSGLTLSSGVFYDHAASSDTLYPKRWTANFGNQKGQSLKLTFKRVSGTTFDYSLIIPASSTVASSLLFGPQSATVTTPPSSTTVTPPVSSTGGYDYPVPASSMAWSSFNSDVLSGKVVGEVIRLESNELIVECRKSYGGAIQIIDKASGQKLVNYADWGRQNENSIYGGPDDFSKEGGWPGFDEIGWNPLTAGDIHTNSAPIEKVGLVTGNDGKLRLYVKSRGINWPTNNKLLEVWMERWYALTGREVDVYSRQQFFRADQTYYPAHLNEYPCFMRSGKNILTRYYTGKAPYTNDAVTATFNQEANGSAFSGGNFMISEPWVATERNGVLLFLNTERMGLLTTTVYSIEQQDCPNENCYQTTYNNSENWLVIDPNGTWTHHYGFYVTNNFSEGRAWANARPRLYGDRPGFHFNVAGGRNDWYVDKGTCVKPVNNTTGWKATFVPSRDMGNPEGPNNITTAARSSLNSPVGSWKASLTPTLYITLKYSGSQPKLRLSFRRNGQADFPGNSVKYQTWYPGGFWDYNAQYFDFIPIKDGQFHTYQINCAANPAWKDVIQRFQINFGDGSAVVPQEDISLLHFSADNPN